MQAGAAYALLGLFAKSSAMKRNERSEFTCPFVNSAVIYVYPQCEHFKQNSKIISTISGAPSPPREFAAVDVTSRCVRLQWATPENTGGTEITGYILERRQVGQKTWTKVVTLDSAYLQYTVENLKEKSEFEFRIFAENAVGVSSPVVTEAISLKTHASTLKISLTITC